MRHRATREKDILATSYLENIPFQTQCCRCRRVDNPQVSQLSLDFLPKKQPLRKVFTVCTGGRALWHILVEVIGLDSCYFLCCIQQKFDSVLLHCEVVMAELSETDVWKIWATSGLHTAGEKGEMCLGELTLWICSVTNSCGICATSVGLLCKMVALLNILWWLIMANCIWNG